MILNNWSAPLSLSLSLSEGQHWLSPLHFQDLDAASLTSRTFRRKDCSVYDMWFLSLWKKILPQCRHSRVAQQIRIGWGHACKLCCHQRSLIDMLQCHTQPAQRKERRELEFCTVVVGAQGKHRQTAQVGWMLWFHLTLGVTRTGFYWSSHIYRHI